MESVYFEKIMTHINFDTINESEDLNELSDLKKAIRLEKGQLSLYENKISRKEADLKKRI